MSAQPVEELSFYGSQPCQPTFAESYVEIDKLNAQREALQSSEINHYLLEHQGIAFCLDVHMPTDGLRSYANSNGFDVIYPHLLMSHGVASDGSYFNELAGGMNKLGIGFSTITLPRTNNFGWSSDNLLAWHSGAMVSAYNFLQEQGDIKSIAIGGHSMGAMVAVGAGAMLGHQNPIKQPVGILELAPAGHETYTPESLAQDIINLGFLAVNSIKQIDSKRQLGRHALMIAKTILSNPRQSIVESIAARCTNISDTLVNELGHLPIFIITGKNDEFIDHKNLIELVKYAPTGNISLVTLDANHMLADHVSSDTISLADPRLQTGQILAWLQSLTDNYSPLAVSSEGKIKRLKQTKAA